MELQKKSEFPLFLYIALWLMWRVQAMFITSSIVSLMFFLPFTCMTVIYAYKGIMNMAKPKTLSVLSLFFFVMLVYGGALLVTNDALGQKSTSFLIAVIGSMGPIFVFYVFASRGLLNDKNILFFFVLFLVTAIMEFYANQVKILTMETRRFDDITNNVAYDILGLFPFLFLMVRRPILQYVALTLISYYVITGFKRGAILIFVILLIFFVLYSIKYSSGKKRWFSWILLMGMLVAGINWLNEFYANSEYFQYRVEMTQDGDSNQRDVIYSTLWQHYLCNDNILQIMFGEGAYHTENVTRGLKAHNDWLELLIDCGFFGVILYFVYWIVFIIDLYGSRYNKQISYILASCLVFTFLRTLYSMSFTNIPFYISMMMGYGFAAIKLPKPKVKILGCKV